MSKPEWTESKEFGGWLARPARALLRIFPHQGGFWWSASHWDGFDYGHKPTLERAMAAAEGTAKDADERWAERGQR